MSLMHVSVFPPPHALPRALRLAGVAATGLASLIFLFASPARAQCYGGGTPGSDGRIPRITVSTASAGAPMTVSITNLAPTSTRIHVGWRLKLGCTDVSHLYGPGAVLIPALFADSTKWPPFRPVKSAAITLPVSSFVVTVPESWAGRTLYVQAFVEDGWAQAGGFALSDGLGIEIAGGGIEPPASPTDLVATAVSGSEIDLAFVDRSTDETAFVVARRRDGTSFVDVATLPSGPDESRSTGTTRTFRDSGLASGTRYIYRVTARNAGGSSSPSATASATTWSGGGPAAPTSLIVQSLSPRATRVNFRDSSTDESGFRIERRDPGTGFRAVLILPSDSAQRDRAGDTLTADDFGLAPDTTYDYRVIAYNAYGESSSAIFTIRTPTETPNPPTALSAVATSGTSVILSFLDWSDNEDVFYVERRQAGQIYAVAGIETSDAAERAAVGIWRSFADSTVLPGVQYFYRVRASNAAGSSAYSNIATVSTPSEAPPVAPHSLEATTISESATMLTWIDASMDESGFEIESRTDSSAWRSIATVPSDASQRAAVGVSRSFVDAGLASATTYTYRVRAWNGYGSSAHSNEASARTHGDDLGLLASVPSIGQDAHSVVFSENCAFLLARTFGVQAIDLTRLDAPKLVSSLPIAGRLNTIVVSNGIGIIAGGDDGLVTVDLRTPGSMSVLASLPLADYRSSDLTLVGRTAYIADYAGGLEIIDVGDATRPFRLATLPLLGSAFGVDVKGTIAVVAAGTAGFHVVDVANPRAPRVLRTIATANPCFRVTLSGDGLAFVTMERAGFAVYDVRNPSSPVLLSSLASASGTKEIHLVGRIAFAVEYEAGVRVIDFADAVRPRILSTAALADRLLSIDVKNGVACVTSLANGLDVLDVTNLSLPAGIGVLRPPIGVSSAAATEEGFVLTTGNRGLQVIDARSPDMPSVIYSEANIAANGAIDLSGKTAAAASGSLVTLLDVSRMDSIRSLGTFSAPDSVTGLDHAGSLLAVAAFRAGFRLVDVSNPASPSTVGSLTLPYAMDVSVAGGIAYVAGGVDGLWIVDVSDPARPSVLGNVDTTGVAGFVDVSGGLAAIGDGGSGVQLVDVSDPRAPRLLGLVDTPGAASDVSIEGGIIFVADADQGVHAIDATDTAAPFIKSSIRTPGRTRTIAKTLGHAFVTDNEAWLNVIAY